MRTKIAKKGKKPIPHSKQLAIVKIKSIWEPVVIRKSSRFSKQNENWFDCLDGWNEFDEIAIDGMNCVGKSSLSESLNRRYIKINNLYPHITTGPHYNINQALAFEYMAYSTLTFGKNLVWDRSPFSNFIFYIVHNLMNHYKDQLMPLDKREIYPKCIEFMNLVGGLNIVKLVLSKKNIPIIFMVTSDFKSLPEKLVDRGQTNFKDLIAATQTNYQISQYYAFSFFAEMLKMPLIDIATCGGDLNFIQNEIKKRINTLNKDYTINIFESEHLSSLFNMNDLEMLFEFSNK